MTNKTFKLPRTFWDDHLDRCSEHEGVRREMKVTRTTATVELDCAAFEDLLSDARHYALGGLDEAPRNIVASAKRTLAIIQAA